MLERPAYNNPNQNQSVQNPQNAQPPRQMNPEPVVSFEVSGQEIVLTPSVVVNQLVKGNKNITQSEVMYFMNICRGQGLNPFVNDAYLIKYGDSPAQIVVSCAALEKRAESFPNYDGMAAGVIVKGKNGIEYRNGSFYDSQDEKVVGGWAEVYRKDRPRPVRSEVSLSEYTTGRSTWKDKPAIMIRKCAKATALREAFPSQNANIYVSEEMDASNGKEPKRVSQRLSPLASEGGDF